MGFFGSIAKFGLKATGNAIRITTGAARAAKGAPGLGLSALLPGKLGGIKYAIPAVGLG